MLVDRPGSHAQDRTKQVLERARLSSHVESHVEGRKA